MNWSQAYALNCAQQALVRFGFAGAPLELISFRQNALYRVMAEDLLLRVYSPSEDPGRASFMVEFAQHLAGAGFPAQRIDPRPATALVDVDGAKVSAWEWLDESEGAHTGFMAFGQLLRQLHDLDPPLPEPEPQFNPLARIERRLGRLQAEGVVTSEQLSLLQREYVRLNESAGALRWRFRVVRPHGWCTSPMPIPAMHQRFHSNEHTLAGANSIAPT